MTRAATSESYDSGTARVRRSSSGHHGMGPEQPPRRESLASRVAVDELAAFNEGTDRAVKANRARSRWEQFREALS